MELQSYSQKRARNNENTIWSLEAVQISDLGNVQAVSAACTSSFGRSSAVFVFKSSTTMRVAASGFPPFLVVDAITVWWFEMLLVLVCFTLPHIFRI